MLIHAIIKFALFCITEKLVSTGDPVSKYEVKKKVGTG